VERDWSERAYAENSTVVVRSVSIWWYAFRSAPTTFHTLGVDDFFCFVENQILNSFAIVHFFNVQLVHSKFYLTTTSQRLMIADLASLHSQ
jgi:hypothetical protein